MGFNLATALGGAVQTFMATGNPYLAAAGGAMGGLAGGNGMGTAAVGNAGNGFIQGLNSANQVFDDGLYAQQMWNQQQLNLQSTAFDEMMNEQSESMREVNTLRDVQMAQRKADDTITKKFIESITQ